MNKVNVLGPLPSVPNDMVNNHEGTFAKGFLWGTSLSLIIWGILIYVIILFG